MRLAADGTLRLSPTDLANHLACAHLTRLELLVQRGELARPHIDDRYGELMRRKGDEHERAYLARIEANGTRVARMRSYEDCFYATELERIQGRVPEHVHVELGTGVRETAGDLAVPAGQGS